MRVGILFADSAPDQLIDRFGPPVDHFTAMLEPDLAPTIYNVLRDEFPSRVSDCDAYLISGSDAGVYDDFPWVLRMRQFLLDAKGRLPLVGICFGHQLMADTFGGRAVRCERGAGRGFHRYDVVRREPWLSVGDTIRIAVSHQDQVDRLPPDAHIIARSAFTPFAALSYADQSAISFQGHPEHSAEFCAALLEQRRAVIGAATDALIAQTREPNDRLRIIASINHFLRAAQPARGAHEERG